MEEQLYNAPCGFLSLTDAGVIKSVNKTFLNMVEYTEDELIERHIEIMLSMSNKFFFHTYFYPFIRLHGNVDEMFLSLKSSGGKDIPILLYGKRSIRDGEELIDCICAPIPKRVEYEKEIRTISIQVEDAYREKDEAIEELNILYEEIELKNEELMALNEQLELMATTDNLTGLYNRQFFQSNLLTHIANFQAHNTPLSLMIVDIDYFKQVNDTHGHFEGDRVLVELARLMKEICTKKDVVVRYGGEEFVILLPSVNAEEAKQRAESLRIAVENNDWGKCQITVSIGIDTFTAQHTDHSIVDNADAALYYSKNHGRNRVTHRLEM